MCEGATDRGIGVSSSVSPLEAGSSRRSTPLGGGPCAPRPFIFREPTDGSGSGLRKVVGVDQHAAAGAVVGHAVCGASGESDREADEDVRAGAAVD